ncbi:hypothetical protein [Cellulosimicrobium cellulans]|uniref:Uncharacterized protein n=1 Tax=Cellulosimicrobium cellulans TaxID=1710 RepID=A0A4Y4E237_CELCE|nr:hypothetical protein [Cellulosimicrobium cellulans]GED08711.1 hypothetical protein CCE02nite_07100 [Cellulosimicrobium cellulans]
MDHRRRRARPGVLLLAALVTLTACSGSVTPEDLVTRLADEPTSEDALSDTMTPDEMDPATARRLGDLDGIVFYAGAGTRDGQDVVCLVTVVPGDTTQDDAGAATCGLVTDLDDSDLPLTYQDQETRGSALLVPDGLPTDADLTRLTPNLAAVVSRTP